MSGAGSKDRWQLTQETLLCLLHALHAEEAAAAARYQRLQQRLLYFFMRHRMPLPEDLADEVINRVAGMLCEGRAVDNVEAFSLGVARMVLREEQGRQLRQERCFQEAARNKSTFAHTLLEREDALDIMEAEVEALPPPSREMLEQYHHGEGAARIQTRRQLAARMGVPVGTLRKRVFDLQSMLRRKLDNATAGNNPAKGREDRND